MTGVQVLQSALEGTKGTLAWFVSDFSDADLLVRPVPGANHAAWQIGNIIGGDVMLVKGHFPDATFPELPAGFMEKHGDAGAKDDTGFHTKAEYLRLLDAVRSATIAALGKLADADLDQPTTGDLAKFVPTVGKLFQMASDHTLLHVGQFTVIRRHLGKPVLF